MNNPEAKPPPEPQGIVKKLREIRAGERENGMALSHRAVAEDCKSILPYIADVMGWLVESDDPLGVNFSTEDARQIVEAIRGHKKGD